MTLPVNRIEQRNKLILMTNLYTGPDGDGNEVGMAGDLIIDVFQGVAFKVEDVIDNISILSPWTLVNNNQNESNTFFGFINKTDDDTYLKVDTSTFPYRCCVSSFVTFSGSSRKYAKIFLGRDISSNGKVISAHYENNRFVGPNVPLEKVIVSNTENYSLKTLKETFLNSKVENGEEVTVVIYSETDMPTDYYLLKVHNTRYVKSLSLTERYIEEVELVSSYLSPTDSSMILIPMNTSLVDLGLMAKVIYNDGMSITLPIDNSKVRLEGAHGYISNSDGKIGNLNLIYMLGENEYTLNAKGNSLPYINKKYTVKTVAFDGNYTLKLFVVPHWVNDATGYVLDYYLYDLDRGGFHYATPYVELVGNRAFDPRAYGTLQKLEVSIDVSKVNRELISYRHNQVFTISLLRNGRADDTLWTIGYENDGKPDYGNNLFVKITYNATSDYKIDLSNGFTSTASFLNNVFYATRPLIDTEREKSVPAPTHFIMDIGGYRTEHELSKWNNLIDSTVGVEEGKSVILHWIRKIADETLYLGCSPLSARTEVKSLAIAGSNIVVDTEERLIQTFLEIPVDNSKLKTFDSAATISFNENGTYELLWTSSKDVDGNPIRGTGYIGDWLSGTRNNANQYSISLATIDVWKTSSGSVTVNTYVNDNNYTDGVPVHISGNVDINFNSPYAPTGAYIEISLLIRNVNNGNISALDTIKLTMV